MAQLSEAAIKPCLDQLWLSLGEQGGAIGWAAESVVTIAGCLNKHSLLAATESLFAWRDMLPEKRKRELLLPTARAA